MRDGLTVLAGLVVLALLAALVAPAFVDWNQQRAAIEEQLRRVTGLDLATTGPIHIRLLPTPRLKIAGLRVGDADPVGTRLSAGILRAEVELTSLLKGEIRVSSLDLDGADLSAVWRDNQLVLPRQVPSGRALPGIARQSVTRGQLTVRDEGGTARFTAPMALEATLPPGGGTARIEGEVAGRSLRITTGERDAEGRLRIKLSASDSQARTEFDGWLGLSAAAPQGEASRRLSLRPDGQLGIVLAGTGEGPPALSVMGRLGPRDSGISLASLALETPAGRLDGEARWSGMMSEAAEITLQTRRADLGPWLAQDSVLDKIAAQLGWLGERLPELSVRLAADQLSWRGEEATEAQLTLRRRGEAWQTLAGQIKFSGATASFGEVRPGQFSASFVSPDLRRIALAMQRLAFPQALAEDIAALGQISVSAEMSPVTQGWRIGGWRAQGRFGTATGAGEFDGERLSLSAAFGDADVLFLVRPLAALATLLPLPLELTATGRRMRIGDSPPGDGALELTRANGRWRIGALSLAGFDGLDLAMRRPTPTADELRFTVQASRAEALSTLAERLTEDRQLTQIVRSLRGVAPVRLTGVVSERERDWQIGMTGQAGPLTVEASGRADAAGQWRGGEATLTASDRGVLFRALGLPRPASVNAATRLTFRLGDAGPTLVLSGSDGLAFEARGRWAPGTARSLAGPLDATLSAPSMAALLPAFLPEGARQGALTARFRLRLEEGAIGFDEIAAELGAGPVSGALDLSADGTIAGRLSLPEIDAGGLARLVTGGTVLLNEGAWGGSRFAEPPPAPMLRVALESPRVLLPEMAPMRGAFRLALEAGALRLTEIALSGEGAAGEALSVGGSIEAERAGGQLSLRAAGRATNVDLARLVGGDVAGMGDITLQIGASGESAARLAASLTGAAEVKARGLVLNRLDPQGLDRITQGLDRDIMVTDAQALAQSVRRAIEAAPWRIGDTTLALVVAGGVVRLSPVADARTTAQLSTAGSYDIRTGALDLRAAVQMTTPPRGWTGQPPQVAVTWRGPARQAQRSYDVSVLSNAVAQRALQREIERVEALEADIRERAQFNRRLRAERERREEEQRAAEEARRREEQARQEQVRLERERQEQVRQEQIRIEQARQEQIRLDRDRAEQARQEQLRLERERAIMTLPAPRPAAPALPPPIEIPSLPSPRAERTLPPPLNLNPAPLN